MELYAGSIKTAKIGEWISRAKNLYGLCWSVVFRCVYLKRADHKSVTALFYAEGTSHGAFRECEKPAKCVSQKSVL